MSTRKHSISPFHDMTSRFSWGLSLFLLTWCDTTAFKMENDISPPKQPLSPLVPLTNPVPSSPLNVLPPPTPPSGQAPVATPTPSTTSATPEPSVALDLLFLLDRTSKKALRIAPKLVGMVDQMKRKYEESKFALSFYGSFICTDMYSEKDCPAKVSRDLEHMEAEGCYTFNTSLTSDVKVIKAAANETERLRSQRANAGVAGVMLAATDSDLHWEEGIEEGRYKVIFVITNKATHCCNKKHGIKSPPLGDGTDRCLMMDDPTPEFVGGILRKQGMSLFLALADGNIGTDTFASWKEMAKRMGITYETADWTENNADKIFAIFNSFLAHVIKERKKFELLGEIKVIPAQKQEKEKTASPLKVAAKKKEIDEAEMSSNSVSRLQANSTGGGSEEGKQADGPSTPASVTDHQIKLQTEVTMEKPVDLHPETPKVTPEHEIKKEVRKEGEDSDGEESAEESEEVTKYPRQEASTANSEGGRGSAEEGRNEDEASTEDKE